MDVALGAAVALRRRAAKAIDDSRILMVENAMIYSQYFSLTLRDIDRGLAGDDRKDEATRKGMRTIARQLLGGKKRLTEKDRALCNEMLSMFVPELVEEYLDEYFTRGNDPQNTQDGPTDDGAVQSRRRENSA